MYYTRMLNAILTSVIQRDNTFCRYHYQGTNHKHVLTTPPTYLSLLRLIMSEEMKTLNNSSSEEFNFVNFHVHTVCLNIIHNDVTHVLTTNATKSSWSYL